MTERKQINLTKYIMLRQFHGGNDWFYKNKIVVYLPRNWDDIKFWVDYY